jgi:hypothetical protein
VIPHPAWYPLATPNEWLRQGRGEPLTERRRESSSIDFRLPVVTSLLAGPPNEHRDRLQGQEFPVAAALFGTTRCWYEIPAGAGILRHEDTCLKPHDLVLLEYDLGRFHDLFEMDGRIAVAWVESQSLRQERHLEAGVIEYSPGPDDEDLELIVGEPDYRRWKNVKYVEARVVRKDKSTGRVIRLGTTNVPVQVNPDGHLEPLGPNARQPISYRIRRGDIVAVGLGMFRK